MISNAPGILGLGSADIAFTSQVFRGSILAVLLVPAVVWGYTASIGIILGLCTADTDTASAAT